MPFGKTRERKRRAQSSSVTATRRSSASETFPRPKQVCFYHLMKRNVKEKKKKSHSAWLHGHSLISTGLVWHHGNHLRQRRGVNLRWWQITFPFLIFENRNRLINFKINICGKCSFTDWTHWLHWLNLQWGNTITVIRCAAVIVSCIYQICFLCPPEKVSPFGKGEREHFRKGGKGVVVVASCYSNTDQRQKVIVWPADLYEMFWGYIVLFCYSALYFGFHRSHRWTCYAFA